MWSPKAPQYLSHSPPPVTNNDLSLSFFIWFSSLLLPYSVQSLSLFLIFYLLHIPLVFLCMFFSKKNKPFKRIKRIAFHKLVSFINFGICNYSLSGIVFFPLFLSFSSYITRPYGLLPPPSPPPASAHSLHTGIFDKRISLIVKLTISRTFRIPWRVIKGPEFTETGILRPLSKI